FVVTAIASANRTMRHYRRGRGVRRGRAELETVDHPFNAFSEVRHVEIDQQPHAAAAQLEIGEQLRLVNGVQHPHDLQLDDDCFLDDHIDSVADAHHYTLVLNWDRDLKANFE